ncbi:MAG TPA: DUF72 domain-containing protein [Lacunisphaera sp.]|nr:DUF72 domain-containing protein [Lacunisphaera sp.]
MLRRRTTRPGTAAGTLTKLPRWRISPPPEIRIGISGWTYSPWRGTFYPSGVRQQDELAYASRQVSSIEINGTFYSLQAPASYAAWHDATPAGFVFSVKGPRFVTHIRRLKEPAIPLANFFASGVLRLGAKLGPILWQLPPSLRYDPERLEAFLQLLPQDTTAARKLARHHDRKVKRTWFEPGPRRPLRHALEVRHKSFETPEFIAQLRRHGVALVVADTAGKWPFMEDITADFVYIRLHGDAELYVSGYTPEAIRSWARKIRIWRRGAQPAGARLTAPIMPRRAAGRAVYVYFDNDVKVRAPFDALSLVHALRLGPAPPSPPPVKVIKATARTRWPGFPRRTAP